ncbi:MAG: efflux RND transporter periplasmic adaptor subunit [Spirochaetales bacterium]|nr:efflux RND transporter periplasmic adaptor subunit [Spirochaetales bacterium]
MPILFFLTACGADRPSPDAPGSETDGTGAAAVDEPIFAINVTPAVRGEINDYIEINGDVRTTASVDVFSFVAGEVARLNVRVGRRVRAGDVIAEVDPSRPGQNFSLSPVRAPIDGTITLVPVNVGSQVSQTSPIAQISLTDELEIIVRVAERFISRVREGLPAVINLDAFPDRQFSATVGELSPVVDPLTRTLEMTLRFTQDDPRIRAGMFAEVRIITERKENIVKVPADVMIRRFGDTFVFVVRDDGTVERRSVVPGIEIDNKLEIVSGLVENELVVYQGQNLLEDGSRVRVIATVEPLTAEDTLR